ncbi:hypothetical protein QR98_0012240 [Sarcoptes scabiei]|uniref:Uncharacterized protein n=1 Tax=Sarcoptes scabiei TaxID=52283 RepID=A0A131ZVE8_SARSC|nr:hypothetical protein QR98_0012240 [Sarcoptes scabiei]
MKQKDDEEENDDEIKNVGILLNRKECVRNDESQNFPMNKTNNNPVLSSNQSIQITISDLELPIQTIQDHYARLEKNFSAKNFQSEPREELLIYYKQSDLFIRPMGIFNGEMMKDETTSMAPIRIRNHQGEIGWLPFLQEDPFLLADHDYLCSTYCCGDYYNTLLKPIGSSRVNVFGETGGNGFFFHHPSYIELKGRLLLEYQYIGFQHRSGRDQSNSDRRQQTHWVEKSIQSNCLLTITDGLLNVILADYKQILLIPRYDCRMQIKLLGHTDDIGERVFVEDFRVLTQDLCQSSKSLQPLLDFIEEQQQQLQQHRTLMIRLRKSPESFEKIAIFDERKSMAKSKLELNQADLERQPTDAMTMKNHILLDEWMEKRRLESMKEILKLDEKLDIDETKTSLPTRKSSPFMQTKTLIEKEMIVKRSVENVVPSRLESLKKISPSNLIEIKSPLKVKEDKELIVPIESKKMDKISEKKLNESQNKILPAEQLIESRIMQSIIPMYSELKKSDLKQLMPSMVRTKALQSIPMPNIERDRVSEIQPPISLPLRKKSVDKILSSELQPPSLLLYKPSFKTLQPSIIKSFHQKPLGSNLIQPAPGPTSPDEPSELRPLISNLPRPAVTPTISNVITASIKQPPKLSMIRPPPISNFIQPPLKLSPSPQSSMRPSMADLIQLPLRPTTSKVIPKRFVTPIPAKETQKPARLIPKEQSIKEKFSESIELPLTKLSMLSKQSIKSPKLLPSVMPISVYPSVTISAIKKSMKKSIPPKSIRKLLTDKISRSNLAIEMEQELNLFKELSGTSNLDDLRRKKELPKTEKSAKDMQNESPIAPITTTTTNVKNLAKQFEQRFSRSPESTSRMAIGGGSKYRSKLAKRLSPEAFSMMSKQFRGRQLSPLTEQSDEFAKVSKIQSPQRSPQPLSTTVQRSPPSPKLTTSMKSKLLNDGKIRKKTPKDLFELNIKERSASKSKYSPTISRSRFRKFLRGSKKSQKTSDSSKLSQIIPGSSKLRHNVFSKLKSRLKNVDIKALSRVFPQKKKPSG